MVVDDGHLGRSSPNTDPAERVQSMRAVGGEQSVTTGFGLDAVALDERLRLFHFVTGAERFLYLAILRVFDRARHRYQVQLNADEVAAEIELESGAEDHDPTRVQSALDQLTVWKVLHRSHDAGRVASIAEYRRRNSVYQLTEIGFLAFSAVDSVIRAKPSDAELRRLAFPSILADLEALAQANSTGDASQVLLLLDRLNDVLTQLSDRAARFYLMIGELAQAHEAKPELFLRHKDLLLAHLMDFLDELQRHRPRIAAAVARVATTGEGELISRAAGADTAVFITPEEKHERWRNHWKGIERWFIGETGAPSTAERLDALTAHAIADLLSLLRRVMHGRRGGVSRESQLQFLARWFVDAASEDDAHALFGAAFGMRSARHLAIAHGDVDAMPIGRSWWTAPPVQVSATLRAHGKPPSPGRPGQLRDNSAARAKALAQQQARRAAEAAAAESLATTGIIGRVLGEDELALLLRLLDVGLQTRGSYATGDTPQRAGQLLAEGQLLNIRIRLRAHTLGTTVKTTQGRLRIPDASVEVERVSTSRRGRS
jgi:uncharacterized protein (TIGR02677 family)